MADIPIRQCPTCKKKQPATNPRCTNCGTALRVKPKPRPPAQPPNRYEGFRLGGPVSLPDPRPPAPASLHPSGGGLYSVLSILCFLAAIVFAVLGGLNRYYGDLATRPLSDEGGATLPSLTTWMAVLDRIDLFQGQFALAFLALLLGLFFNLKASLARLNP